MSYNKFYLDSIGFSILGIVSKGVCEPVDRLTLFRGTFSPHILSKAKHYKCIELLRSNKWAPKSVNLLSRSVRQSPKLRGESPDLPPPHPALRWAAGAVVV